MNRVSILLLILLNDCHSALSKTPSDIEVDADKIGDGQEDIDDEQQKLLGMDYYNGDAGTSRQEYDDSVDESADDNDILYLKNKFQGDDEYMKKIVILDTMDTRNYRAELLAGNKAVVMGTNPHYYQPNAYPDFSRRFVPQYPYREIRRQGPCETPDYKYNTRTKVGNKNKDEIEKNRLTPQLASPELVLQVAKESAIIDAAEHKDPTVEVIRKDILRTGDYWNSVWKEEVDPQSLRTMNAGKKLESVRAEIPPGKLHNLITKLKKISPTILYVINEKNT